MKLNKIIVLCLSFIVCVIFPFNQIIEVDAKSNITQNSKASILVEYGTGEILTEYNSTAQLPIASVTKLMTILLAMEKLNSGELKLEQKVIASENASGMGGSQVFIDANSEYKVENLLHAIIIASANDASVAIAETIAGSEQDFVNLMNKKASELQLENTHYVNCTGLPAPSQYSCAKDVAKIMRELLKYPLYFEISGIWMEDFEHPSGRITTMANTNKLLKAYSGCDAGKTGSTNEAGYCLATTATKNNMRLISVILGADTSKHRFYDASEQLNWGFNNYESKKILDKTQNLALQTSLQKSENNDLVLNAEEDFYSVCKKGQQSNLEVKVELPEILFAPIKVGDTVGKIYITQNDIIIKEINIISNSNISRIGIWGTIKDIVQKW